MVTKKGPRAGAITGTRLPPTGKALKAVGPGEWETHPLGGKRVPTVTPPKGPRAGALTGTATRAVGYAKKLKPGR